MYRVALIFFRDSHYFLWHGGREQNCLSVLWYVCEYGLDILAEAHIQHLVGFVKYHRAQGVKLQRLSAYVIHYSSGSADNYIGAAFQLMYLLFHACAAVYCRAFYAFLEFCKLSDLFIGLHRQFPRRAQDKYSGRPSVCVGYAFHGRDAEGSCLACSCVGTSHNIASFQQKGNALLLYLRHFRITQLVNGTEKLLR